MLLAHVVNGKAAMNSSGNDPDDKVVVDTVELEVAGRTGAHHLRGDDGGLVRAKGTREQVPLTSSIGAAVARTRSANLARDPAEVLRTWPHSMSGREARAAIRATTAASPTQRVNDKITLAHLALDLFREVEQIQADPGHIHTSRSDAAACTNRNCNLRINALRGALVEALLLVQRVAMLQPTDRADIEDRIQELLELLDR